MRIKKTNFRYTTNNRDESQIYYAERRKSESKGYVVQEAIHRTFWKKRAKP